MSVHLKIEEARDGIMATLSQRDDAGTVIGHPSVGIVTSAADARQLAKTLARSLGLKVYGVIDKTETARHTEKPPDVAVDAACRDGGPGMPAEESPPWLVPGVGGSL